MDRPEINRRKLITGLSAIICAPAIVRASSLMPVRAWKLSYLAEVIDRYGNKSFVDIPDAVDAKLFQLYQLQYKLMGIEMPKFCVSVTDCSYEPANGEWDATWA